MGQNEARAQSQRSRSEPELASRRLWEFAAVRDLVLLVLVLFIIWFGFYLRAIFTPVLIALVLGYVFDPAITWLEERSRLNRLAVVSLMLTLSLLIAAGLAVWLIPMLIDQIIQFSDSIPGWVRQFADKHDVHLDALIADLDLESQAKAFEEDPLAVVGPVLKGLFAGSGHVADALGSVLGAVTYVAVTVALIPVYFFFFAWRFWPMVRSVEPYLPETRRSHLVEVAQKMDRAVAGFIRGRLIIAAIMTVMFSVGFALAGVPYWLLLGIAGGVLGLVPFIGGAVWPLAMVLKYLQLAGGEADLPEAWWWAVIVWPTVVFAIVQFVEGWILTPWIGGKSVNLDTVTTIIVVFIGGAVGGMYGLLLCIPIAACLKILLVEEVLPRLRHWAADH